MHKQKKFLAIIPARGGSKRLPRKNVLHLSGKPLITYSIEAGTLSKYVDDLVVSSDNEEILKISQKFGANIIVRPDYLASDSATTYDAVKHTLENISGYDYLVLLQPTSPLRTARHIDEAIEFLDEKDADAVVSVSEMEHSPLWSNSLPDSKSLKGFLNDEIAGKRSQDLEKYFRVNGAIYICKIDKFLEEKTFFIKDNIFAYEMSRNSSIDIDEAIDFKLAEVMMTQS